MEELTNNTGVEESFDMLEYFSSSEFWNDSLAVSLLASLVVFSLVLLYMGNLFHNITKGLFPGAYVEKTKKVKSEEPSAVMQALTDVVPIEEEHKILMDHDYDGIKELDNNLPPWWIYGFYFCVIWGVIYFTHYHVMDLGPSSTEEYNEEIMDAREEVAAYKATLKDFISAENVVYLEDAGSIANGKEIYTKNCKSCHLDGGAGDVGPNLTDEFWLNGGDIKSIYTVVNNGKGGMPKWAGKLKSKEIQKVISYLHTLQGSNPPNGKEPEGEKYVAE